MQYYKKYCARKAEDSVQLNAKQQSQLKQIHAQQLTLDVHADSVKLIVTGANPKIAATIPEGRIKRFFKRLFRR